MKIFLKNYRVYFDVKEDPYANGLKDGKLLAEEIRLKYKKAFLESRCKTDIFMIAVSVLYTYFILWVWQDSPIFLQMLDIIFMLFGIFGVIGLLSVPFAVKKIGEGCFSWKRGLISDYKIEIGRSIDLYAVVDDIFYCNMLGFNIYYPEGTGVIYIEYDGFFGKRGIVIRDKWY